MCDTLKDKPKTQWDSLLAHLPMFQFALCAHSSPQTVLAASRFANSSLVITPGELLSPFSFKGYLSYFEGLGFEIMVINPMQVINVTPLSPDLEYLFISLGKENQTPEIITLAHNQIVTLPTRSTEGVILFGIKRNIIEGLSLTDSLDNNENIKHYLKCCFEHLFKDLHIANNHKASISALQNFKQHLSGLVHYQHCPTEHLVSANDPPASLKSAIRFIQEHPGWEFSPQTLAQKVNTSERNLYYQFKRYTKTSPYRFHLRSRLFKAREQIISESGYDETIAYHAVNSGFFHLSRFSSLYKEIFGELPSTTKYKRAMLAES